MALSAGLIAVLLGSLLPATGADAAVSPCQPTGTYAGAVDNDRADVYYRLGETSGLTMCDSSAAGTNGGTYAGSGLTYKVAGALVGDSNPAVAANGTGSVIGASDANWSITGDHDFSLEGWYRNTGAARDQALVAVGAAGAGSTAALATWSDHACGAGTESASTLALDEDGASNCWDTLTKGVSLYDGDWHYLEISYTAGTGEVTGYIDGQSLGTQPANTTLDLGTGPVLVGKSADPSVDRPLLGDADEIAVYQAPLTATEVAAHYADADRPAPAITFTTTSAQATASGAPGATASLPITIARANGADGAVTLTPSGLPSGVTLTPGSNTIAAGSTTTTLQFSIAAGAQADTSTAFTIAASTPGPATVPAALAAQFKITGAATGVPAITLTDGYSSILGSYPGGTVGVPISIVRSNGATGAVTLSVTSLPPGVTVTGGTTIAAGVDATTVQFAVAANAPLEEVDLITINATSPGVSAIAPLNEYFEVSGPSSISLRDPETNSSTDSLTVGLEPCAAATVSMTVTIGASITTPTTLTLSASGDTAGLSDSLSQSSVSPASAGSAYGQPVTLSMARTSPAGSGPVTITITATNVGGSSTATVVVNRAGLTSQGLFITQGSQYDGSYGLLLPSSPALSGDDYSGVTLVAGKKTVVRLYADAPGETEGLAGVTALLYGYDSHGHQLPGSPLLPDYGTASGSLPDAHASASSEFVTDSELESDANAYTFTLPYSWTGGHLTEVGAAYPKGQTIKLIGTILPPPAPPSSSPRPKPGRNRGASCAATDDTAASSSFTLRDVPFTEVGAHYQSVIFPVALDDKSVAPPSPQKVFPEAEAAFPLPDNDLNLGLVPYLGVIDASTVFKDAGTLGWVASNHQLLSLLENDIPGLSTSHIVGVSTPDFGWTNAIPGSYSVVTGGAHRPLTSVAHELGHQFGLPHASAACGGNGVSWPPDQQGYLDGIGLDTASEPYDFIADGLNGQTHAYDFMSYCAHIGSSAGHPDDPDDWLSPRNWQQLISNFGTGSGSGGHVASIATAGSQAADPLAAAAAVDSQRLVVTGFVDSQGVQIANVGPQIGAAPPAGSSVDTYTLTARGAHGQVVATVPMAVTVGGHIDRGAGPPAPLVQITGDLPAGGVQSVQIANGSTVMAGLKRPALPPQVRILAPRTGAHVGGGRAVVVRWRASSPEHQALTVSVDYSADGGRTWRTEFVGPNVGQASLASFDFAPSLNARVRLRVSDGFNEMVSISPRFTSLGAAPDVTIQTSFAKRMRFAGDASLQLAGQAIDQRLTELPARSLSWFDGPFRLGTGPAISSGPLPAGVNHIRLVARAADGLSATRSITVTVNRVRLAFLTLSIPKRLSRGAHTLSFKAKASIPAKLTIDGKAFVLKAKLRRFSLAVGAGDVSLLLRVAVTAGKIRTPFAVALGRG